MKSLVAILAVLTGCSLYSGGSHSGDDVCEGDTAGVAVIDLRNPQTDQCVPQSYGGGGGGCGVAPVNTVGVALPDWATCDGTCETLGESDCLVTSGCRAVYLDPNATIDASMPVPNVFSACRETAPTGPLEGGGCSALDAQDCSAHDDCIAVYTDSGYAPDTTAVPVSPENFEYCGPEAGSNTCADVTCGAGFTCIDDCTGSDALVPTCAPQCVATLDPGSCTGTVTCNIAGPVCPTGTVAGILDGCYSGYCIPQADCGPGDPGACGSTGGGVMCAIAPPPCPSGSEPGFANGCWTGYCIPDAECPVLACGDLMSEAACDARPDCTPVYDGTGCTCEGDSCTCTGETYDRCDSLGGIVDPGGPVTGTAGAARRHTTK